jgi:hypothetical protein
MVSNTGGRASYNAPAAMPNTVAQRQAYLKGVRAQMQRQGKTGSWLAQALARSPSQINAILRGNWPHAQDWGWPQFFQEAIDRWGLAPASEELSQP